MTRWTVALAAAALLMFAGCDSKDSDEAKEYERTQALDNGEWDKVLSMTTNCGADDACRMDRAAALVGRAGFTLPNVIAVVSDDDHDKWVNALGAGKTDANLNDLKSASAIYTIVIDGDDHCNESLKYAGATYYQKAACIPQGMVIMSQVAILMQSISGTGGDTEAAEAATLLNGDLDIIANLTGESKEAIEEIKDAIRAAGSLSPGADITAAAVKAYKATL